MKTSELTGAALDWAVAKCEGATCKPVSAWPEVIKTGRYSYSTDWARGGPIIEREQITITPSGERVFAECRGVMRSGKTMLIAAMRCYVYSKLGDEVEIPEELK